MYACPYVFCGYECMYVGMYACTYIYIHTPMIKYQKHPVTNKHRLRQQHKKQANRQVCVYTQVHKHTHTDTHAHARKQTHTSVTHKHIRHKSHAHRHIHICNKCWHIHTKHIYEDMLPARGFGSVCMEEHQVWTPIWGFRPLQKGLGLQVWVFELGFSRRILLRI